MKNPSADCFVPDGADSKTALRRATHVGIGAHQDDLEIMAFHGIAECYDREDRWFLGITCTNGAGSARAGSYSQYTDEQMRAVRKEEQRTAAKVGQYTAALQLDYPSAAVKDPGDTALEQDLHKIFLQAQPELVYTHNPADKHDSHVGVLTSTLNALKSLPAEAKPKRVYGCEVWRDLDWLGPEDKVALDVSARAELGADLVRVFESQIAGGKRYDLATLGRRRANATYYESHATDGAQEMIYALDLTPLIQSGAPTLEEFVLERVDRFREDVQARIRARS